MADRAAIGVGRRDREVARHRRPVAAAPDRVGRRPGAAGQAVERAREPDDLVAAARELGHADRRLVGLAAGVEEDHLLQLRRQQGGELAAELDHLGRQHPAEQMERALAAALDRSHHGRMVVAERRAHLARGEVEQPPSAVVVEVGALRPLDEEPRKVADIADHVTLDRVLQLLPALLPVRSRRAWVVLVCHRLSAHCEIPRVDARRATGRPSMDPGALQS